MKNLQRIIFPISFFLFYFWLFFDVVLMYGAFHLLAFCSFAFLFFVCFYGLKLFCYAAISIYMILLIIWNLGLVGVIDILGAHAIAFLFFATIVSFVIILKTWFPKYGLSIFAFLIVGMLILKPLNYPVETVEHLNVLQENGLAEPFPGSQCERGNAGCQFEKWLLNRPNLQAYRNANRPYPVFLVSAAGGGIYAASHSFHVLNNLRARCREFMQHTFAISSVSGGSFGVIPFYLPANEAEPSTVIGCNSSPLLSDSAYARDHLTRAVAGMVFANIPNFFFYTRFQSTSVKAIMDSFQDVLGKESELSVDQVWSIKRNVPAPVFNVTESVNGVPQIISPLRTSRDGLANFVDGAGLVSLAVPSEAHEPNAGESNFGLSLLTAASLSSRFPFLTPPGFIEGSGIHYFDGGYFDNSGLSASKIVREDITQYHAARVYERANLERQPSKKLIVLCEINERCKEDYQPVAQEQNLEIVEFEIHHVFITDAPADALDEAQNSYFFDPVKQIFASRAGRITFDKQNYRFGQFGQMNAHDGYDNQLDFGIPFQFYKVPLSWTLNREANNLIGCLSGGTEKCKSLKRNGPVPADSEYTVARKNIECMAAILSEPGHDSDEFACGPG